MKNVKLWIGGSFLLSLFICFLSADWLALLDNPSFKTWRDEFVVLSGIFALVLMVLAMVVSVRPAWIDSATDGLDKAYKIHKWAGIAAVVAVIFHWIGESAPKIAVSMGWLTLPEHARSGNGETSWDVALFHLGNNIVEWGMYLMIVLAVVAIFQKIPYRWFRHAHKLFSVVFLAAAFHSVTILFKLEWWTNPAAIFIIALSLIGSVAAVISLTQRIGASRKRKAIISKIDRFENGIIDVTLDVPGTGFSHKAGQFAYISFEHDKEPHPFTIASSGNDPHKLRFVIKALGDFTNELSAHIREGQKVEVEGPYGQFDFDAGTPRQVWVAGGIGVTPFMAKLEALAQSGGAKHPIDFWYCTANAADTAFPSNLEALCEKAGVTLHRMDAQQKQFLNADIIQKTVDNLNAVSLWFCGPQGFAESLRKGLRKYSFHENNFYHEEFSMR